MKKQHLITLAITIFFVGLSLQGVHAQTSIAGDTVCGATSSAECTLEDAKKVISKFVSLVIEIGSIALVLFILYRFVKAWFALQSGNVNAYKEAAKQVGNAVFGFVIIIVLIGGFLMGLLKFIGAQEWTTTLLKLLSDAFIPHAYAQEATTSLATTSQATSSQGVMLPNPVGTNSLYDFLLIIFRTVIRWFIYPALIAMWVWSGFSYVLAQGNPEKLSKTHKWLMWAVVTTIIVFMTEGFLAALRGTVNQILN